jgi:hypothetical protein
MKNDLPTPTHADRPGSGPSRRGRSRLLAGSTLGLAGAAAAAVLATGGSTAPPAFAVTKQHNGSVLVHLNYTQNQNLPQVEQALTRMGTHEKVLIQMAPGAATTSGAVVCTPNPAGATLPGPAVNVLVGANGTEVIAKGDSAGNTAEGSFHLKNCWVESDTYTPTAGNSGIPGNG